MSAKTRELELHQISVSEMDNNCYLLVDGEEAMLIDAADDATALLELAEQAGAKITAVLTTHRHADHVRALQEVLEATGARHYASVQDADALPAPVDVRLDDGDTITLGDSTLDVRILRGHTPGGVAVIAEIDGDTHAFVGDSLFPGGVGKTENPEEFHQLLDDATYRLFDCYDDAIIHPGHGEPTTLAEERGSLDRWRERGW